MKRGNFYLKQRPDDSWVVVFRLAEQIATARRHAVGFDDMEDAVLHFRNAWPFEPENPCPSVLIRG